MADTIFNVAIVGTGFSGICAGIKLLERGEGNFVIVEKANAVGGTWRENTYPGAACDIPAPLYCFSFEPNPDWSRLYPPQSEICTYIAGCAQKYGLMPHIRFHQHLTNARFDDSSGTWTLEMKDGGAIQARHVIMGHGGLHEPSIPDFPGLKDFSGPAFHTARWEHDANLSGKNIAIVGSAASAIQIIPELAKIASHLHIFQRTPNYINTRGDRDLMTTEKTVEGQLKLRQQIFEDLQANAEPLIPAGSEFGEKRGREIMDHMHSIVQDERLYDALTPDYQIGCKRVLISDNFYQTLNLPNVTLETQGIERFEADAIITGTGERIEVNAVIFATGFDLASHSMSVQYWGKSGKNLLLRWMHGVDSYRGVQIPQFPNLYFVTGPNTGVATTSVVVMVEAQLDYILKLIETTGHSGQIEPREEPVKAEDEMLQVALAETVWAKGGCNSWYQGQADSERISTLYPFGVARFIADRAQINRDDFDVDRAGDTA